MKPPQHPLGPAFDRARSSDEQWRQQQLAALTPEQRKEYDRRTIAEQKQIEADRDRIAKEMPKRVETETQRLLSGRPAPELRPHQSKTMKYLHAKKLAQGRVEQSAKVEIERKELAARDRQDGYLRQAEKDRQAQKQQPEKKVTQEFNKQAQKQHDNSLSRAFEKAKQRQDNQQEQDRRNQQSRNQRPGRERGPH
tara:strand:+ start:822 stop:1406 length:585 start_codon:yes stop_codon:yes gene_type:complete